MGDEQAQWMQVLGEWYSLMKSSMGKLLFMWLKNPFSQAS